MLGVVFEFLVCHQRIKLQLLGDYVKGTRQFIPLAKLIVAFKCYRTDLNYCIALRLGHCRFWRFPFLSAYLNGTDDKKKEVRFYKGWSRKPLEKFNSVLTLI